MDAALANAPHAMETDLLEVGAVSELSAKSKMNPGDYLVQGIMAMVIGVPLVAFGILLSIALLFVFGVIYAVASFLGLGFITRSQDKLLTNGVNNGVRKVNQALDWIVPKEGIKIGEIRRQGVFRL